MKEYKKYTRQEMIKIAKEEGFLFVETSKGENFIIKKGDVCDFIIHETNRNHHSVDIAMYVPHPDIEEPFLTTMGWFLNRINQNYRNEIIERLVRLQTGQEKPRKIKVFDNDVFSKISLDELGEKKGQTLQFDKFFKKYYEEEEEMEAE